MKNFPWFTPILIFTLGFLSAYVLISKNYLINSGQNKKNDLKNKIQVSNSNTSKLPDSWTSCTSDSECAYLPNPCCPGWTSGAFNRSVVRNKPVDTSICKPAPTECISAQPVIPNGKIIRPVCRNRKCSVAYENKNSQKPIRMGIPCKESKQCPGPAGVCGNDGFCIEENK